MFNFPAGDTVCRDPQLQVVSYYYLVRNEAERLKMIDTYAKNPLKTDEEYYNLGRQELWKKQDILVRPIDREDNYIKRCVAIPGDTLQIINGQVFINGSPQIEIPGMQYDYGVATNGRRLNDKKLMDMGIYSDDIMYNANLSYNFV